MNDDDEGAPLLEVFHAQGFEREDRQLRQLRREHGFKDEAGFFALFFHHHDFITPQSGANCFASR